MRRSSDSSSARQLLTASAMQAECPQGFPLCDTLGGWRVAQSVRHECASIAAATSPADASGIADAASSSTSSRAPGIARAHLAVADREERVSATVHHERRERELGQPLAPARLAVELGEDQAHLIGHVDRGLHARRAVPDAPRGRARGRGSLPRIAAPAAANSATAARSDQSGTCRGNSRPISAASWSGRSSSGGPGATGRVPARVSAENASGCSSAATWATIPPTPRPARCAGWSSSARRAPRRLRRDRAACTPAPRDRRWSTRRSRASRSARRGVHRARAPRTGRLARRASSSRP